MRFVVTAGPTREYLDPVRYLSNPSTGKMGFAVASAAARRGHDVTLVAGPVALRTPKGVRRVDVTSAREMLSAVADSLSAGRVAIPRDRDPVVVVSTAAVADWRPAVCAAKKLKKREMSGTLRLVRNPDILRTLHRRFGGSDVSTLAISRTGRAVAPRPPRPSSIILVGFAAETNDVLAEAARKCREKGLAFIVANDVTEKGSGFGTDTDRVTFVYPDGRQRPLPLESKRRVASALVREVERIAGVR